MADIPFWRDVSLILLAAEAIVICLPLMVIGYYLIRGLASLHRWLREMLPVAQQKTVLARDYTERYAAIVATPAMALAGAAAALAAAVHTFASFSARWSRTDAEG
ncbi:MAG: hypothetical protein ACP5TV_14000 [Anaerolineae bacterium]